MQCWRDRLYSLGLLGVVTISSLGVGEASYPLAAMAQPVPDETLGAERSEVLGIGGANFFIDGGASRGANLFHSFQEFSVENGGSVYFLNPTGIENILSRVTGSNPSNILGTLGVFGSANLFLMNPNGIVFGPNARLDVQGSFVATTADAIGFGEQGVFSAIDPQVPSQLLTVNPSAFFFNQVVSQGGTISNEGNLTAREDLTLWGNNLELQGQLRAGRNLTLQASDTLRIRDTVSNPFVAASGREMVIQGNQTVDIFALNHPNSGLFSGGDMVLRSANQVGGDAHYWSGGNFRIEQLNGGLGDLSSPYDPVIRVAGDLTFNNYIGSSLHILAGGSVIVPGTIVILSADTPATSLAENVTLSDGTVISINGSTRPTLDIRAGVDPSIVDIPGGFEQIGDGFFPGGGDFFATPTSAGIVLGSVIIEPPDGQVFITNQYRPNLSLPSPEILITGRGIARLNASPERRGIDARGFGGNGSSVTLDSRGSILVFESASISSSSLTNASGDIRLIAGENILLAPSSGVEAFSDSSGVETFSDTSGGNIALSAGRGVSLNRFASVVTGNGGEIGIEADELVMERFSQISSPVNTIQDGGDVTIRATNAIRLNGGNIFTLTLVLPGTPQALGDTGNINIETGTLELTGAALFVGGESLSDLLTGGDISSDVSGSANAGNITITADQIRLLNGAQIRASTFGTGNTGDITIRASELVEVTGRSSEINQPSKIAITIHRGATGNGGNLLIETNRFLVQEEAQIQAGVFGAGQGGNVIIDAPQSIEIISTTNGDEPTGIFTGPEGPQGSGNGGTLNITAGQLTLQGAGAQISNEVDLEATGNSGSTRVVVDQLTMIDGGRIRTGTLNTGRGGSLQITASDLVELSGVDTSESPEPSGILIGTVGLADAGDLTLTTSRLTIRDGAAITASTFGLGQNSLAGLGRGGNIVITADAIEISGRASEQFSSNIASEAGSFFGITNSESRAFGGDIRLTTGQLIVQDGGFISTQTVGAGNAGNLTINATGNVQLLEGNLQTRTLGVGRAGDITITAGQLIMQGGEATAATNSGGGRGGNISVSVEGTTELINSRGGFAASSFRSGDAGNLILQTNYLIVRDGAGISTESIGNGRAGDLTIIAPGGVEVIGGEFVTGSEANERINRNLPGINPFDPEQIYFFPSRISASVGSILADTQPANLSIQTGRLTVRNGGEISTQTLGSSSGGRLSVNAPEISIIGNSGNMRSDVEDNPSSLSARTSGIGNAGNIQLTVRQLQITDGGSISAASAGSTDGSSVLRGAPGSISIQNADSVALTTNGEISTVIESGALIEGSLLQSGNINLQTRSLNLTNNSAITANTAGQGNAGSITIRDAQRVSLSSNSSISTAVEAGAIGQGGDITLRTGSLNLNNQSQISAATFGTGQAGNIFVEDANWISLLSGSEISTEVGTNAIGRGGNISLDTSRLNINGNQSRITASTAGRGRAGEISIDADRVSLTEDGRIITSTDSTRRAGNITLNVQDLVAIDGRDSGLFANTLTNSTGSGGSIRLNTTDLQLSDRAQISAQSEGTGSAGDIRINARGNVTLSDRASISTQSQADRAAAGNIRIEAGGNMTLRDRSIISTRSQGENAEAGNIRLTVGNTFAASNSDITTSAENASGGDIRLTSSNIRLLGNTNVTTDSAVNGGNITFRANAIRTFGNSDIIATAGEQGGNILLSADSILAFGDSDIIAAARQRGGDIVLDTPAFFGQGFTPDSADADPGSLDGNDRVDINASGQVSSGSIVRPDTGFVQDSLADLPESAIDTEALIASSCVVRSQETEGTFIITGRGGLPERPGEVGRSVYATGEVQSIPETGEQSWQLGDPIVEPQGLYQLEDGRMVLSQECD